MSDLTIFGKTFTDVKGIKATDTDGNEVVYGGGYSIEDIALRREPSGDIVIPSTLTNIYAYAFDGCKGITSVTFEGMTYLSNYAFGGCSNLRVLNTPYITRLYRDYFNTSYYAFQGCTSLEKVCFPSYGNYVVESYTFQSCTSLAVADFANCSGIRQSFHGCSALRTLILRRTGSITPLTQAANTNSVGGIYTNPLESSIFVPQDLISSYQSASNWSTLYNLNNDIFKPIEGSQYEHYYADGTPIE